MSGPAAVLDFLSPRTLEERLRACTAKLRAEAEASSDEGDLATAVVLHEVARELDELLSRGTALSGVEPGCFRPGSPEGWS